MPDRYFSPGEVEALIPRLQAIMDRLKAVHGEAASVREGMQAEQQRIALSGGGMIDVETWRANRERLEELAALVRKGLDEIAALGGVPKDLGMGLVDFPHLRGGSEVNLCWRHGESRIQFWHGLDEGYAGRKPL
jgi:hypothetical protein